MKIPQWLWSILFVSWRQRVSTEYSSWALARWPSSQLGLVFLLHAVQSRHQDISSCVRKLTHIAVTLYYLCMLKSHTLCLLSFRNFLISCWISHVLMQQSVISEFCAIWLTDQQRAESWSSLMVTIMIIFLLPYPLHLLTCAILCPSSLYLPTIIPIYPSVGSAYHTLSINNREVRGRKTTYSSSPGNNNL